MWTGISVARDVVERQEIFLIGARYSAKCRNIVNTEGQELSWATKLRYLEVFIEAASSFKCSLDNVKRSFYRSFNSILGELVEWHQTRLLYSCSNQSAYLYYTMEWRHALCASHNSSPWILLSVVHWGNFLTLNLKILETYLLVYLQSQQLPVAGGNFWEKNYCVGK